MPTTHYRDADLFYRLSGEPENPAMLLLHGGFGSAEDFAAILPELQQHFLVVETDARGHGRSTRGTAELTYAQFAEDAHHIVQVTGLREYHIFGFSDGGTAAYRLAAEDTRVLSVVTVGASWSGVRDASVREMFENLSPALFRERMADRVASYERLNPRPHLETLVDDLRHNAGSLARAVVGQGIADRLLVVVISHGFSQIFRLRQVLLYRTCRSTSPQRFPLFIVRTLFSWQPI